MALVSQVAGKVQERFRRLGWQGTARYAVMRAIDLGHDYAYDFRHRVHTRGVSLPRVEGGQGYKGSLPRLVRETLGRVPIRHEETTFIDLGSGKGRTLLIAAEHPFRRVMGVEYSPEFHAVAQANIARYRGRRRCGMVESVCRDVREFVFPPEPLLIYLYNPFERALMEAMLRNLRRSLLDRPRPAVLIYLRPLEGETMAASGFLETVALRRSPLIENFDYAIYRSRIGDSLPAAHAVLT